MGYDHGVANLPGTAQGEGAMASMKTTLLGGTRASALGRGVGRAV